MLRDYIDSLGRPKRLLTFVNLFGGKKSATKIFLEDIIPCLEDADIQSTVIETKHQLHAKEVAKTLDLSKYDGVVCVVNGLLEREDWSAAIKMPTGMVPTGTGNGMVKSLLDSAGEPCSASNAILAVIQGHNHPLDVATILQGETRFFSVLMLAWALKILQFLHSFSFISGLIANIDIESEKHRWMWSARIGFYALQRILHLGTTMDVFLWYLPLASKIMGSQPVIMVNLPVKKALVKRSLKIQRHGYLGSDVKLESMHWRTISGPFVSIWLHNVRWGSEDVMAASNAKDLPKLALLSSVSKMNDGSHVKLPYVTYLKVKAFVLESGPRVEDPTKEGIIDSDGEVLARGNVTYKGDQKALMAYNKLQITVDQGLATFFAPLWGLDVDYK
ncbi:hypothetical protein CRYUN_Cryun32bG0033100 [Craigia yunnanensis]